MHAAGVIADGQREAITTTIESAGIHDFRPVLYVIPFERVRGMAVDVPVSERAHPLSVEYRLERLPRDCFDMLQLRV